MNRVRVSVPGKLMIMGEHAVVYNHPCIVAAINKRMVIETEKIKEKEFRLYAEDVNLNGYCKKLNRVGTGKISSSGEYVEIAVSEFLKNYKLPTGIKITISSQFPTHYGLGSSAAATVGTFQSLATIFGIKLTQKDLFDHTLDVILKVQKTGSGFDLAASIYGGLLYFISKGKVVESLTGADLHLVVAYSGIKADTVSMINLVKEKYKSHKKGVEKIFENITTLVNQAKAAIRQQDWKRLGTMMNYNQDYLEDLGVSNQKINDLILASRQAGAYGAKLSGAGGGDCIIVLTTLTNRKTVEKAIRQANGQVLDIEVNDAQGLAIETLT